MAEFTNTAIHAMLNWLTGNASAPATAPRFITVFNGDPTSGGTEVIATLTGSANRIAMTASMAAAAGGAALNNATITFTASAVAGATVNFVAEYDAITAGNLLAYTAVTSKVVAIGDGLSITTGNLSFSII